MRHHRHYTLEEAAALLAWTGERLMAMRAAHERLTDSEARRALTQAASTNGGGPPGKLVGEAFVALQSAAAALGQREIVLRDLERGLIDFPTLRDGEEAYLCWMEGETVIGFWHELDAGHAGRQAL